MNTKLGVSVFGGELAIYREGQGEPVIFLHGGPGDTHHYMKRMAEPLYRSGSKISFSAFSSIKEEPALRELRTDRPTISEWKFC